MMAGKGGYQRPTSPAPVSGPGSLSQRTDGGPAQGAKYVAGMPYGEGADFMDIQSMAPMEAAPRMPSASSVGASPRQIADADSESEINLVPLNAPSQRPNEPVTAGVDVGAGPGSDVLPRNVVAQNPYSLAASLQPLLEHDTTGDIAMLYRLAVNRGW